MATIDSRKLLPAGRPGGAITESQKPLLVPVSNVFYKKDVKISQKLLKPVDQERESVGRLVVIKKKITKISDVIQSTYLIEQSENNRKRKERERQKSEEREKQLETRKPTKVNERNLAKVSIPGRSILDTINRFIGFTLLGYLFDKYNQFLPKLAEFSKLITPVAKFIESFGKNVINRVIDFIDVGYQAYDKVRAEIKNIGGEGAQKTFDEFSTNLNKILNGAIGAAMLIASTAPRSPKGVSGAIGAGMGAGRGYGYTPEPLTPGVKPGTTEGRAILKPQRAAARAAEKATRRNAAAAIRRGIAGETTEQAAKQLASQGAKQSLKSLVGVPVIGSLIGFIIDTVVFREKPTRAAAGAVGSALGQGIGIFLAGSTTFGLGAGIGMFVGGFVGDMLGKTIYDSLTGFKPEPIPAKAQGGQVSGGQSRVAASRRIKTTPRRTRRTYTPQKTQPGKDIGGKQKIEQLYGKDEPGKRSALRALKKSSEDLKKMKSLNGVAGAMFGAGIDMSLGQKPDRKLAASLGNTFGSVIQAAVDAELDSSFNDISRTIAMANGGVVPSREIKGGMSIGEKIGKYISSAFSIALESSAAKVLQNLNQEFNLKGGAPGGMIDGAGGGPGAGTVSVSSDSPDFWLLAVGSLLENSHPQGAADVAQVIYNRVSSSSWPSTIRGVILEGNGGQFQPVRDYGNISAWRSIKDKESAVDFIKKYGKGRTQSQLESVAASLLDSSRQRSARSFVGPRDSFRATSFEDRENHLADDTEQRRHGHVFGFEPGGAQIGSFRSGKLTPAQVSPQTKGTVTQISPRGLPLTGENGRLKPSQLTRVGTLIGGADYQDWYGNGAYLRNDAAAAFLAAKDQARKEGITIPITSAYRSLEHQRAIQGKYAVVAAPGTSRHGEGTALDIQTGTAGYAWFVENGPTFGWRYMAIPGDPVHFEYVGGFKPSQKQNQTRLSPIFDRSQASLAPSQQSREIASLQQSPSYALVENNTILYQKEFVLT
jgi:hypothetical protein